MFASRSRRAQVNVGIADATGRLTDKVHTFAIAEFVRGKGEADRALSHLITVADAKL
jgi:hypothetical protein